MSCVPIPVNATHLCDGTYSNTFLCWSLFKYICLNSYSSTSLDGLYYNAYLSSSLFQQIYDVCIPTHPMIVYTSIDLYDGPRFKTSLWWFQIQHVPVLSVFLFIHSNTSLQWFKFQPISSSINPYSGLYYSKVLCWSLFKYISVMICITIHLSDCLYSVHLCDDLYLMHMYALRLYSSRFVCWSPHKHISVTIGISIDLWWFLS